MNELLKIKPNNIKTNEEKNTHKSPNKAYKVIGRFKVYIILV
jgi:hypothetical protein